MRLLALAVIVLMLGGCDQPLDRDQARFCRIAIMAFQDDAATIHILGQRVEPESAAGHSIHIDYRSETPGAAARDRFIECRFGTGTERLVLDGVRTEEGFLSVPRLFALNRFWLGQEDIVARDPMPILGSDTAFRLPTGSGYVVQQVINALPGAAVYGLLAAAYSLVYGLVGRINLAFGGFAAIGGNAALIVILGSGGWPVPVALAVATIAAVTCTAAHGVATARLVFKPLHNVTGQQGLVATVGLALVLGEYLRLTQGAEARWIGPIMNTPMALARDATFVVTVTPIALLVALVSASTAAAVLWAMKYSRFGLNWRAFSDDPRAAALFGVGRDRIFGQTFALASGLAGLAGGITIVFFGDLSFAYAMTLGLKALTAAVLGGIGSVPGAFLGGLFIGLLESAWSASFPIESRDLVVFLVLVATLIWRPGGFCGYRDLTPRRV